MLNQWIRSIGPVLKETNYDCLYNAAVALTSRRGGAVGVKQTSATCASDLKRTA